jgi:hypothetical protein
MQQAYSKKVSVTRTRLLLLVLSAWKVPYVEVTFYELYVEERVPNNPYTTAKFGIRSWYPNRTRRSGHFLRVL